MVDKIRIDGILEIPPSVVWEKYIDCLASRIRLILGRGDTVIDSSYDIWMRIEQCVSFNFFQSQGHGFLAEWTADLFEGEEMACGGFLNEVDI